MTIATKLDTQKLLSQLAETKSSGCLELTTELVSWKIYLQQGNLQYVYCSIQTLDRFKYHLHSLDLRQALSSIQNIPQSIVNVQHSSPAQNLYSKVISWLLTEQALNFSQNSRLIQNINKDDFFSCLWLDRGIYQWHQEHSVPLWIPQQIKDSLAVNISECLSAAQAASKQWQNCCEKLISVHQRPYFPPGWESKSLPVSGSLDRKTLMELTKVLKGGTSIRQLSILLKKDEIQVAKILSPYIEEKIIYLHHAPSPLNKLPYIPRTAANILESSSGIGRDIQSIGNNPTQKSKTWKIVCIDDSPTILSEIARFLDGNKFKITAVDDPVQAVSKIFNINPDLILLDITMPKINGYKLCGLLRSSGKCDNTPIIMVTGNTGLIDKARAKLAGATDYFTKPFTKEGLNQIVAKYLPK